MSERIEIKNLNVSYGNKQVLFDVSLTIDRGMFGLLGRNGAGKSTLMKALVGLVPIKSGEISICGILSENKKDIRSIIGYLPQEFNMYPNMKVDEALDYLGTLSEMRSKVLRKRIEEILEIVNLKEDRNLKIKTLSGGMKRRLGIAQAILHNPKVLIVDEPTAGLDPEERIRFRNLLSNLAEDKIVILSTHIVGDIEMTCNRLSVLNNGKIIFDGTTKEIVDSAKGFTYEVKVPKSQIYDFKNRYVITAQKDFGDYVEMKLLFKGKPDDKFVPVNPTIEDGYLNLLYDIGGTK
ncbi:ABC transporter ATP-binding protein [Acetivibrio saccincola]|jgi:ABC-2 type transport system ATP-binding protein|uniref:Putative ABC transporter ATP-binding protein YxlF n=1 Tax=Acetivibrio saccincola TaxID=1677857 RepID=A0A2K9EJ75_9FIRM|nr:ABC transporter ATP-binding protein [Acetivibrio saccincola]AUG56571.1 putative ABC transporter ATP-binding protein YxlF [Acetivibrio saccincola]NLI57163.1 ABC transporter ATP-binding protein [Clostridium sp.]